MSTAESRRKNQILLGNDRKTSYICRINAGSGWIAGRGNIKWTKNQIIMTNPRRFIGAPPGWPDLVGFQTVEITPGMIGKKIAVFTGHEIKMTGNLNAKQKLFRDRLILMGGRFIVDRGENEQEIINGWET